jgi:phage shock protein PspC (stress-responsive transcriptional regulator)
MTMNETSDNDAWAKFRNAKLPRERKLGGVCAALGDATPLAAWMWRTIFCVFALAWGGGVLAYLILWIAIPNEEKK